MIYMAIDPSGNFKDGKGITGMAIMQDNDYNTVSLYEFKAANHTTRQEYWGSIMRSIKGAHMTCGEHLHIVIESFTIRSNGFTIGTMPETIQLIGLMSYYMDCNNISYSFQTPSQAKQRFSDESLIKYIPDLELRGNRYYFKGKVVNDHKRDALKHLLFYKKYKEKRT